ncbi:MAG: hypothetical protein IH948_00890 [Bacteroidetes bacterium]|nr:hypothetical protein [Bacteroidota bacterium]
MPKVEAIEIKPKSPDSRWVALDLVDGYSIIAEGKTPEAVHKLADKTGINYVLSFVPKAGTSYIL